MKPVIIFSVKWGTLSLGLDKKPTPKIMKKCNLILIFALALLPNHTALADCIDCWVNPKTGKLEPFGLDAQQEAARAQSPTAFVYGTTTCPLTVGLIQELKQQKIPFQFKNIEQINIANEYLQLMQRSNLIGDSRIPKVYVKGRVFIRPSVAQIRAVQSHK